MRDILTIVIFGVFMLSLMFMALNKSKEAAATGGEKASFADWIFSLAPGKKEDEAVRAIAQKSRENDDKLRAAQRSMDAKMIQQRQSMQASQERIRAMQDRNREMMQRLNRH